jgi:homoserine dehydrogenase
MPEAGVRVGLVGLGTIGTGVVRLLEAHSDLIEARLGFPLRLTHIADVDLHTDRGVALDRYRLSTDFKELVDAAGLDLIVELIGGTGVAAQVVASALQAGKSVVTANKALLAHKGAELFALARDNGAEIAFEASVAGTIPVLRALREGLAADRIHALQGIVNGTCNFILSEMEERGEPYAACLKRAQELGYAEADPTFDVNGTDSAHKLTILLGLAFGVHAGPGDFPCRGIAELKPADLEVAEQLGYRIKLLASARQTPQGVEARVEPVMLPRTSLLAGIGGALNAVEVRGAFSGSTLYCGAGAGSRPTASAVVADLMELARARRLGIAGRVPPLGAVELRAGGLRPVAEEEGEYCVRVQGGGDLAAPLVAALAQRGAHVTSLLQDAERAHAVATTRRTRRADLEQALAGLGRRISAPQLIRIQGDL